MTLHFHFGSVTRFFKSSIFLHVIGWLIFVVYEVSFISLSVGVLSPFINYCCYYALNILLFYFNALVLLQVGIKSKRSALLIPVFIVFELMAYLVLKRLIDDVLIPSFKGSEMEYIRHIFVPNLYRGVYMVGLSSLYWSIMRTISFRRKVHESQTRQLIILKEKAELQGNLAEARNAFLRQQINPHFLFNTLTFIHNTFYKFSRDASRCVLLLVDIMRFSLDEVELNGKIQLSKEIEQIENFIELNRIRFDYELYIDFKAEGDFDSCQFIPLILLTLAENIFKHGNLKLKQSTALLHIIINPKNELIFHSWNIKKHQPENKRLRSIGIKNVKKRLEYTYPHQYKLNIRDEDETFGIELMVQL